MTPPPQFPPPIVPVNIAGGFRHACVVRSDGTMACWGMNDFGQLGNGSKMGSAVPVNVQGLGAFFRVSATEQTCSVRLDNSVACWGSNVFSQVGDGTTIDRSTPVLVNVGPSTAVAAGGLHTCAALSAWTVACWGNNDFGQLGDGTTTSRTTPVAVIGTTNVASVAAGARHSCASNFDGTVLCWGNDDEGQLGNGPTVSPSLTAAPVPGLSGVSIVHIVARNAYTCVVRLNGTVSCWGSLGTDTNPSPTDIPGLSNIIEIAVGDRHACALRRDGQVACWGQNESGQLGDGTTVSRSTPAFIPCFTGAGRISAGSGFTCATHLNRAVSCWGEGGHGELGDGTIANFRPTPATVTGFSGTEGGDLSARCCTVQSVAGCGDSFVRQCVCATDPYCCNTVWDQQCANEGASPACWASLCGNGIVESPEECDDGNDVSGDGCSALCHREGACIANSTPRIPDPVISSCVCGGDDYCCNVAWDARCVGEANACGAHCDCTPHAPGPVTPSFSDCVCLGAVQDNYCCNNFWDGICINEAQTSCGLTCP